MAKMTLKQLAQKMNKSAKAIEKKQARLEQKAAEESAGIIKDRTRAGFGVSKQQGAKKRLKKLSPAYVKQLRREGLRIASRLTHTGEMLDSIKASKGKVTLEGTRNQELAGYAEKKGRPFLHLSSSEYKRVVEYVRKNLIKILGL
jgi:Fe-S cluster assembly ATPase SufC